MKKRCLALILAIMLCISLLPLPAVAEDQEAGASVAETGHVHDDHDAQADLTAAAAVDADVWEEYSVDPEADVEAGVNAGGDDLAAVEFAPYVLSANSVAVSVPTANTSKSARKRTAANVANGTSESPVNNGTGTDPMVSPVNNGTGTDPVVNPVNNGTESWTVTNSSESWTVTNTTDPIHSLTNVTTDINSNTTSGGNGTSTNVETGGADSGDGNGTSTGNGTGSGSGGNGTSTNVETGGAGSGDGNGTSTGNGTGSGSGGNGTSTTVETGGAGSGDGNGTSSGGNGTSNGNGTGTVVVVVENDPITPAANSTNIVTNSTSTGGDNGTGDGTGNGTSTGGDNGTTTIGGDNGTSTGGDNGTTTIGGGNGTSTGGDNGTTTIGGDNGTSTGGDNGTTTIGGDNGTSTGGDNGTTTIGGDNGTTTIGGDNGTSTGGDNGTTTIGGDNGTSTGGDNGTTTGGDNGTTGGGNGTNPNQPTVTTSTEQLTPPSLLTVTIQRIADTILNIIAEVQSNTGIGWNTWDIYLFKKDVDLTNTTSSGYDPQTNPNGFSFIWTIDALTNNTYANTSFQTGEKENRYIYIQNITESQLYGSEFATNETYNLLFTETPQATNATTGDITMYPETGYSNVIVIRIPGPNTPAITFGANGTGGGDNGGNGTSGGDNGGNGTVTTLIDLSKAKVTGYTSEKAYTEADIEQMGLKGLTEDVDYTKTVKAITKDGELYWAVSFDPIDGRSEGSVGLLLKRSHTHVLEYTGDEYQHWQRCTVEGCTYETEHVAHSLTNIKVLTNSTCTDGASIEADCSVCGMKGMHFSAADEADVANVPALADYKALGHDMEEIERKKADCVTEGYVKLKCKRCDLEQTEILEKLSKTGKHSWRPDVGKMPTCLEDGVANGEVCSVCNAHRYDGVESVLPALGHDVKRDAHKVGHVQEVTTDNGTIEVSCYEVRFYCDRCGLDLGAEYFTVGASVGAGKFVIEPGKNVNITDLGNGVHIDGNMADDGGVYFNGQVEHAFGEVLEGAGQKYTYRKVPANSYIIEFEQEYLDGIKDGEYELIVMNGEEYWPMTVVVKDHRFVEIKVIEDNEKAPEWTVDQLNAWKSGVAAQGLEIKEFTIGCPGRE